MRVFLRDGYRTLTEETTKAILNSLSDFEKYWKDRNQKKLEKNPLRFTKEEMDGFTAKTILKVSSDYKENDEIIHFDDHGIAPRHCEREFLMIRRNNEIVKTVLISMS